LILSRAAIDVPTFWVRAVRKMKYPDDVAGNAETSKVSCANSSALWTLGSHALLWLPPASGPKIALLPVTRGDAVDAVDAQDQSPPNGDAVPSPDATTRVKLSLTFCVPVVHVSGSAEAGEPDDRATVSPANVANTAARTSAQL
jgi:hypothetical protein